MPRKVDHDSRRRLVAEAVCRLVGREGIEAATLREVAAEAGVSMGAVQRCFQTRQQMLIFAQEHVNQRIAERAKARIAASLDPESVVTMVEEILTALLVCDEDLVEARVWIAFTAQAAVDPTVAAAQREHYRGLTEGLRSLVTLGQQNGQIAASVDADRIADELIAITDGLMIQVLMGRHTLESARTALHAATTALRT
ncbi:TetR/AcrR family transcriptional regulator [Nocardia australiensis]|uniref:TetR/AcrR family transcriptional regulator n=1 Tax=Nocardia australiensis TaxID=2887191 RepID=UPI001D1562F0|nr:TetR family transcriptional regulator C-terminal domain-containing protein [Nocardia australiensis]